MPPAASSLSPLTAGFVLWSLLQGRAQASSPVYSSWPARVPADAGHWRLRLG
jgi:hypothetical protein